MKVHVEKTLFDQLMREMVARGYSDDVTRGGDVLWLHTDVGPTFYLTRDGRLIGTDFEQDEPELLPDMTAVAALVCGARAYSEPRLLDLLPARPAGVAACSRCSGKRWWPLPLADGKYFEMVCPGCSGLGFVSPEFRWDGS
jgi:hypothetical protein